MLLKIIKYLSHFIEPLMKLFLIKVIKINIRGLKECLVIKRKPG